MPQTDERVTTGVVVVVPARAEFVRIVRGVVSSLAVQLDLGLEDIDDLRLAVDEACAHLLAAKPAGGSMTVRADVQEGRVVVLASVDAMQASWPPTGARHSLAWQVLNALTEDVSFERTPAGPAVRFAKRAHADLDR